jgi:hypothetical protein
MAGTVSALPIPGTIFVCDSKIGPPEFLRTIGKDLKSLPLNAPALIGILDVFFLPPLPTDARVKASYSSNES